VNKQLRDSARGSVLSAEAAGGGGSGQTKLRIRIMEGNVQGSSGYYPAEVLRRDGPKHFVKGTHMHLDHMGFWEMMDGSPGKLETLAGFLDSDAVYETGADGIEGLYADAIVISKESQFIKEVAPYIGVSILAAATSEPGISPVTQAETDIITGFVGVLSVDFVTHPGANGRIVQTLESNRNLWPEGFQFVKDHPAIESAGETKKGKPMAELSDEAVKALESLPALIAALSANTEAQTAAIEAAKPKEGEDGPVDVVATVLNLTGKLQESALPAAAQAKVLAAIQANPKLSPDDAIAAEKAYIESLTAGYKRESEGTGRPFGQLLIMGETKRAEADVIAAAEARMKQHIAYGKVAR
jgi:hypothetical protein